MLVQGADPMLCGIRRGAQRVVDELLGGDRPLVRARRPHVRVAPPRGADADDADDDDDDGASEGSAELPAFAALVNALQSPPFMTATPVVVVPRHRQRSPTEQGKWLAAWIADPLDGVHLVLVAGGGRVPAALDKAVKANGAYGRRARRPNRPPTCSRARAEATRA